MPANPATSRSDGIRIGPFTHACTAAVGLICLLVLLQGGFYAGAVCAAGAVSAALFVAAAVVRRRRVTCAWTSVCLLALACLYLASALAHGASLSMLQEAATWFALAGMSLWCAPASHGGKERALEVLAGAGVVLAAGGVLMFAGLLPVTGAVSAGRLMFTFQYANTAGLFFAVVAVLCLCSRKPSFRTVALVPIAALALTQSVGAIAVFLLAAAAVGVRRARTVRLARGLVVGLAVMAVAAVVLVAFLMRERIGQAAQTFLERIVQMLDAAGLLAGNLALGIGPDQWQFAYPAVQSAQYRAADVHCSYLQVALDGGLPALAVLIVLLAAGMRGLARRGEFPAFLCAAMIALHALFDFDFQFASIVLLTALLLAEPVNAAAAGSGPERRGAAFPAPGARALGWAIAACAMAASCAGIWLDVQAGELQGAYETGDAGRAKEAFESASYMQGDPLMQLYLTGALYRSGDYGGVLGVPVSDEASTGNALLCRIASLHGLGDDGDALAELSAALRGRPYDVEFYAAVRDYIVQSGLGGEFTEVFDGEAARANELAGGGHAAWLSDQEAIEPIGDGRKD